MRKKTATGAAKNSAIPKSFHQTSAIFPVKSPLAMRDDHHVTNQRNTRPRVPYTNRCFACFCTSSSPAETIIRNSHHVNMIIATQKINIFKNEIIDQNMPSYPNVALSHSVEDPSVCVHGVMLSIFLPHDSPGKNAV